MNRCEKPVMPSNASVNSLLITICEVLVLSLISSLVVSVFTKPIGLMLIRFCFGIVCPLNV